MSALIANPALRSIVRGFLVWSPLWIVTTFLFGGLGVVYVLFLKQDTFLASQAILVRDEATGAVMRLGRFQSQAEMKAAQETILEMAKSQPVVRDALIAVGRPESLWGWKDFPSKELIEDFAKTRVTVHAPKGTEFGVTEVIYLDVIANEQNESLELSKALCDALESRLQKVRKARADGVIAELTHARESAKRELDLSTDKLHEMESIAGSDLSDLRGMSDSSAGPATSRTGLDQIKSEIRQAEVSRHALLADRELLVRASKDPTSFIVAPGAVLNSQPGLKRLREGLVDAQLSGSQLSGRFTENHPLVNASQTAQSSIVRRFLQELNASVASVESDIELVDIKIRRLETERIEAEDRLTRLADSRSSYANVLFEVRSKLSILESAEKELAEVKAARESSISTSLLTRLDAPIVSDRPVGPGRTTIAALCSIAGLVFGLGIVFVVTPIDAGPSFGRRSIDRARGRREFAPPAETRVELSDQHRVTPNAAEAETVASCQSHSNLGPQSSSCQSHSNLSPPSSSCQSHSELSPPSSSARSAQNLANSIAELSIELEMPEAYQPLIQPKQVRAFGERKPLVPASSNSERDFAFQELSRLKSLKTESRPQEQAVQMHVQDLKGLLPTTVYEPMDAIARSQWDTEETPRQKPRPAKQSS